MYMIYITRVVTSLFISNWLIIASSKISKAFYENTCIDIQHQLDKQSSSFLSNKSNTDTVIKYAVNFTQSYYTHIYEIINISSDLS